MQAYKIEATVEQDGSLTLRALPFQAGERVEVIVLPAVRGANAQKNYPLRGTIYRYEDPTGPVAEDDWESDK